MAPFFTRGGPRGSRGRMRSRSPPHTHTSFSSPIQSDLFRVFPPIILVWLVLCPGPGLVKGLLFQTHSGVRLRCRGFIVQGWSNSSSALGAVFKSTPSFNHSNLAEREKHQPLSQIETTELGKVTGLSGDSWGMRTGIQNSVSVFSDSSHRKMR